LAYIGSFISPLEGSSSFTIKKHKKKKKLNILNILKNEKKYKTLKLDKFIFFFIILFMLFKINLHEIIVEISLIFRVIRINKSSLSLFFAFNIFSLIRKNGDRFFILGCIKNE
jgi:hypothetical protein